MTKLTNTIMIKVLLGALLITTASLAQTAPKTAKTGSTKPTASSMASSAKTTKPMRPLPQPSLKEKLESGDDAIPSYKKEKDAGVHKGVNRYTPRRTASGARKDTLIDRRKP
ncbi:hypothetical protein [Spirosoma flavum]|uniref:Uncharacterized protein n=1 Tax=Spirosoma flavum TaxID=2048557 RepID=A0ABW6AEL0_9BACT